MPDQNAGTAQRSTSGQCTGPQQSGEHGGCAERQCAGVREQRGVKRCGELGRNDWQMRKDAKELRECDDPQAQAECARARAGEENERRPEDIKLLFNGEAPEMKERERRDREQRGGDEAGEILEEAGIEQNGRELCEARAACDRGQEREEHNRIVEREDAQYAARVEVAENVALVA